MALLLVSIHVRSEHCSMHNSMQKERICNGTRSDLIVRIVNDATYVHSNVNEVPARPKPGSRCLSSSSCLLFSR